MQQYEEEARAHYEGQIEEIEYNERARLERESRMPKCHACGKASVLEYASPLNTIHGGRPYYICPWCPWGCRWVCWADSKGLHEENPLCDCKEPSRLDIIGQSKPAKKERGFWTCKEGKCGYYSENRDGKPGVSPDGGFYP